MSQPRSHLGRQAAQSSSIPFFLLSLLLWGVAIFMVAFMALVIYHRGPLWFSASATAQREAVQATQPPAEVATQPEESQPASLPAYQSNLAVEALDRGINWHTIIPTRMRMDVARYTVQKGDSIFGIAQKYDVSPETVLWANKDKLRDDPHMISIGLELKIPPTTGIYYQWKDGDTLDAVAAKYKAKVEDILNWPGNKLDLTNPVVKTGEYIMIPGGSREFQQWLVPTVWKANSGASRAIPGACDVPDGGAVGSGSFVWPTANHFLSGNDYFSGHLGIDIAAATGAPVYAADSGVVVYAGPIGGGYGNMIMIDHGNGYHTLYAHLSSINVRCGQSVLQGNLIGLAGSTGNSTGPHLHFEVRYMGGFINPWYVLP